MATSNMESTITRSSTMTTTRSDKFPPLQVTRSSSDDMFNEHGFDFPAKSKFNAGKDLLLTRSDAYVIRKPPPDDDIWKRQPPNFCPQSYASKPPKRNSRESMKPWKYGTYPGHKSLTKKEKVVSLPKALQPRRPKSSNFVNKFKILDSFEAKCVSLKEGGNHSKEQYRNPKPYDFRQYPPLGPLGLPEFDTAETHDPYNINFKSQNLDILHGIPSVKLDSRYSGRQMGQEMDAQPRYEPDMIIPKGKWPNPGEEFTRHRQRNRSPHAALLGRIEDTLNSKWSQEKAEKERLHKEWEQHEKERKFREGVMRKLEAHEADQWRRTGPGGWSDRGSQRGGRNREPPKGLRDDRSSSSGSLQTLTMTESSLSTATATADIDEN